MNKEKRILTGIQPSGNLHLGNYFAVVKKLIQYQENSDLFCFIADYHSLTSYKDKETYKINTKNAILDLIAFGVCPEKCTFWLQSDVYQVLEVSWYLSMTITVNELLLSHSYKDKVAKGLNPSSGLLYYPVLMASDILTFSSDKVPVGKDQKQHLEITREIARDFNRIHGKIFKIPEAEIDNSVAIIPGINGQKMSKSYNNTIYPFDTEKRLKKSIMSIVTDSANLNEPKSTENNTLFQIYSLFLDLKEKENLKDRFLNPGLKYSDIKNELFSVIMDTFKEKRHKREILKDENIYIQEILKKGAFKASEVASQTVERIKKALNIGFSAGK